MKDFAKSAKALAKNPLGIVALFLVLVYGMATLLFGFSASSLSAEERWPIILFIIFFPVLVLLAFYRLVTKHHNKLYAPADWSDESHFLRAMNIEIPHEAESEEQEEVDFEVISGKTFGSETIVIDGKRFEQCNFNGTRLKFKGRKSVQFADSGFNGVMWVFGGNAALTFAFVSTLYQAMGEEFGAPLLDSVISGIKGQQK